MSARGSSASISSTYVPIAAHIRRVLDERPSHRAPRDPLQRGARGLHVARNMPSETLHAVVAWGRYGEVFAYDDQSDTFSLENPA